MTVVSSYLSSVVSTEKLKKTVGKMVKRLRRYQDDFDGIAFRGLSGALLGPLVAMKMDKKMLMVRKRDGSHSHLLIEGDFSITKYIIIDDQIATGNTMRTIVEDIGKGYDNYNNPVFSWNEPLKAPTCVGIALYHQETPDMTMKTYKCIDGLPEDAFIFGFTVN